METPDIEPEENQEEAVDIYSKNAIRGFSIFFSTIFGGVLLFQNLREVGHKKAANAVLFFSIFYTLIGVAAADSIPHAGNGVPIVFNVIGGFILSDYFFPKYFPDNDYYPKPIWRALGFSLLICLTLIMILYYTGNLPQLTATVK